MFYSSIVPCNCYMKLKRREKFRKFIIQLFTQRPRLVPVSLSLSLSLAILIQNQICVVNKSFAHDSFGQRVENKLSETSKHWTFAKCVAIKHIFTTKAFSCVSNVGLLIFQNCVHSNDLDFVREK